MKNKSHPIDTPVPLNYSEAFLYYFCQALPRSESLLSFYDKILIFNEQINAIGEEYLFSAYEKRELKIQLLEKKLAKEKRKLDRKIMADNLTLFKRDPLDNWWKIHLDLPCMIEKKLEKADFTHQFLMLRKAWEILNQDYQSYKDHLWSANYRVPHNYRFRYFLRKTKAHYRDDHVDFSLKLYVYTLLVIAILTMIMAL